MKKAKISFFFLKIEEKSGKRRKMRKTNSDEKHIQKTVEKSELKKRCVSEKRSIGISRKFFFKIISSSSQLLPFLPPLLFSKKLSDVPKFKRA